jgi:putative ABC transport system permease protein
MSSKPPFRRAFRLPGQKGRVRRDVDDELAFHVAMREQDLVEEEGMDPDEARDEAIRQFGDVEDVRRECRRIGFRREGEMRLADSWDRLRQDVRFASRQFVKTPLVTLLAVLTLGIGIASATVVYTVIDAVVLDAVPLEDADRLVAIHETTPAGALFSTSEPNFLDWRARQTVFDDIGAYSLGDRTLTGVGEAERLSGLRVSHSTLPLLGLDPVQGRHFRLEEDEPGGETRVALLSAGFWERRFASDPDVIGRMLTMDGEPFEIAGVVPSDRAFPGVDVFTPLVPDPDSDRGNHMLQVVGRLSDSATLETARDEVARIAASLAQEYPVNSGWGADVTSLYDLRVPESTRATGIFLLGAVALLLLMACGSVSNMLMARATTRRREMGLRAALGAGRRRIVRQLLTESAVVGVAGALAGIAIAWWALPVVRGLGPADLVQLSHASLDLGILALALALSGASVVVFGLLPALIVTRDRLFEALREGQRGSTGPGARFRSGLVMAQFALAIIVVMGAALTVRSFGALQTVDLGIETEGALRFDLSLPDGSFSGPERVIFVDRLRESIEAMPGVTAAGVTMSGPYSDFQASNHVAAADHMPDRQEEFLPVSWRAVGRGFFAAAGIEPVAGRVFEPGDGWPGSEPPEDWEPSVVIDAMLARALWGRVDVVGEVVVWGDPDGTFMRVIGVVEPVRDEYVDGPPRPRIYLHYDMFPWPEPSMVVRSSVDPATLAPGIRAAAAQLDPDVPVTNLTELPDVFRDAVAWPRFTMQVLTAFGLIALLLAAMGIYGITAFNVARRTREIGIRLALGAQPQQVLVSAVGWGMRLAVVGIVVGVVAALALAGWADALLYQVDPRDPATYASVPLVLAAVAALAVWIPARRATRVDPREALGEE